MRTLLFILMISSFVTTFSQTDVSLKPYTSNHKKIEDFEVKKISLPLLDNQNLIEEELLNRQNKTGRYMFGYEHQTNFNFFLESSKYNLPGKATLQLLKIKSENALSINLVFNDFYLPEGAKLHVYNSKKTTIVGAYTSANNNENNELGTDLIKGDEIIIEYYEPKEVTEKGRLNISTVIHGFEDINNWYNQLKVNESGGCNLDVVCPDGTPWNNEVRSVARITVGGGLCTGSLVNNTENDGKAYFLTANHCGPQSMGAAVFRFNYDSPTCGSQTSADSQNSLTNNTINGSTFKARNNGSDFGLIELNSIPPANYQVYYSGWNNSGDIPAKTVGIHHPSGDVKKLAFDEDSPTSGSIGSANANAEWRILQWDRNTTTEGGSSGSGLWDENHLIVGQLHGGQANCANSINDYYGKFSESWDGNSSTNRLKDWLDPQGTGVTSLLGFDPNVVQHDVNLIAILYPDSINCGNNVSPELLIRNDGQEPLTSLTINYETNGNIIANYDWTGSLTTGDTSTVALPSIGGLIQGNNSISITLTNPNNGTDGDSLNNTLTNEFTNNNECLAYPNPFRDELVINFKLEKTNNKTVAINLTDIQGKIIWSTSHNVATESELKINTSQMAKGTYLLQINYDNESTIQKLIKN